jgi:hypothetical protein
MGLHEVICIEQNNLHAQVCFSALFLMNLIRCDIQCQSPIHKDWIININKYQISNLNPEYDEGSFYSSEIYTHTRSKNL